MFNFFEKLIFPFKKLDLSISSNPYQFFLKHVQCLKKYVLLIALLSTAIAATEVYIFKFLGDLVDTTGKSTFETFYRENVIDLLWMASTLLILLPLAVFLRTLLEHQSLEVNFPIRSLYNLHGFVLKKEIDYFQNTPSGTIANTLLQTSFSTKLVIIKLVNTFTFVTVFFVSMSVLLTNIDILLLIPAILWVGGYVIIVTYFFPKMKFHQEKQAAESSRMIGNLVDTYSHMMTVKIFSRNDVELKYADSFMTKFLCVAHRQMRIFSMVQFVMWGMNILLIFGTFFLSIWLWGSGAISVGAIAASVSVAFRLYTMSHWIMWELLDVSKNVGVVQHGIKLLYTSDGVRIDKKVTERAKWCTPEIEFRNVDFSYPNGKVIFENFSLKIKPGEKIGILGASGSGKSTVVKLLLQLCNAQKGEILFGGVNIKDMDPDDVLRNISVVTQDVQMLHRSIKENLVYGSEGVTDEAVLAVTRAIGAHDFISDYVDRDGVQGYGALAGVSGGKLSGGQKQRVSIARALLKDAEIYIFDEATSALDGNSESQVIATIKTLLVDKTVIIITHKESNLDWVDKKIIINASRGANPSGFSLKELCV